VVSPLKKDVTRILGSGKEFDCEGKRPVGQSRTRWCSVLLEDIKK